MPNEKSPLISGILGLITHFDLQRLVFWFTKIGGSTVFWFQSSCGRGRIGDEDPEISNEGIGFNKVLSIAKDLHSLPIEEARAALDDCGFIPSPNLVQKLLCRLQYDGKAAFRVFQWAGSQPDYNHTVIVYHTMISILGAHGKFEKGWGLITKMHESAMVTRQTLMIMIKRYLFSHNIPSWNFRFKTLKKNFWHMLWYK